MTSPVFTGYERRRRGRGWRKIVFAAVVLVAFGIGIALGQALHDNPKPGGTQTSIRTLQPRTVMPTSAP
ncbi:MAG: hypothetical protein M3R70_13475 [Actinomycetota bacterium]|nr:hypothetical protein [Actinomycetota bacterium]